MAENASVHHRSEEIAPGTAASEADRASVASPNRVVSRHERTAVATKAATSSTLVFASAAAVVAIVAALVYCVLLSPTAHMTREEAACYRAKQRADASGSDSGSDSDGAAHFAAGECFASGDGAPRSDVHALEYFKRAADRGHARAQYRAAMLYASERGGWHQNARSLAFLYFTKAAHHGLREAQYELALCYRAGLGVSASKARALELFKNAADQGHTDAQFEVAESYLAGAGVGVGSKVRF